MPRLQRVGQVQARLRREVLGVGGVPGRRRTLSRVDAGREGQLGP
ncbi:MAG: hypothetical protein ACRDNW_01770 [Trebonia sp.]